MREMVKYQQIDTQIRKLNNDHYVDEEFVRFIDEVYEHKKLIIKTMKRLKPYTSDDVSCKIIKKTKHILNLPKNIYTMNLQLS